MAENSATPKTRGGSRAGLLQSLDGRSALLTEPIESPGSENDVPHRILAIKVLLFQ
jgi:hypothetical protein